MKDLKKCWYCGSEMLVLQYGGWYRDSRCYHAYSSKWLRCPSCKATTVPMLPKIEPKHLSGRSAEEGEYGIVRLGQLTIIGSAVS